MKVCLLENDSEPNSSSLASPSHESYFKGPTLSLCYISKQAFSCLRGLVKDLLSLGFKRPCQTVTTEPSPADPSTPVLGAHQRAPFTACTVNAWSLLADG